VPLTRPAAHDGVAREPRDLREDAGPQDPERTGDVLAVLDAVRSLPTRQREAVVLRYYADLSEAEVARALGCSVGTVKSQLSKARATLSRLLEGADDAPVTQVVHDE
jgi:RNA polymerase sigma factor (sigma-70 family)